MKSHRPPVAGEAPARRPAGDARRRPVPASSRPSAPAPEAEPVAPSLEGVGGQLHVPRARARSKSGPVDAHPMDVGLREQTEELCCFGAPRARACRDQNAVLALLAHALMRHAAQDTVGPELQEACHPHRRRNLTPSQKRTVPRTCETQYSGRGHSSPTDLTREVRDHRESTARRTRCPRRALELLEHRVHQPRVKRVAHAQPRDLASPAHPRPRTRLPTPRARPARRRRRQPQDHSRQPATAAPQTPTRLSRTSRSEAVTAAIPPARRQRAHQPAPRRHQRARVLEREHAGHMGRRELPDRMARSDSPVSRRRLGPACRAPPRARTTPAA